MTGKARRTRAIFQPRYKDRLSCDHENEKEGIQGNLNFYLLQLSYRLDLDKMSKTIDDTSWDLSFWQQKFNSHRGATSWRLSNHASSGAQGTHEWMNEALFNLGIDEVD